MLLSIGFNFCYQMLTNQLLPNVNFNVREYGVSIFIKFLPVCMVAYLKLVFIVAYHMLIYDVDYQLIDLDFFSQMLTFDFTHQLLSLMFFHRMLI